MSRRQVSPPADSAGDLMARVYDRVEDVGALGFKAREEGGRATQLHTQSDRAEMRWTQARDAAQQALADAVIQQEKADRHVKKTKKLLEAAEIKSRRANQHWLAGAQREAELFRTVADNIRYGPEGPAGEVDLADYDPIYDAPIPPWYRS